MRRSDFVLPLLLVASLYPITASAQQSGRDTNQSQTEIKGQLNPQPNQAQIQNTPVDTDRMQQRSDQNQAQNKPVQPERSPQQSDQARERDRQSAEDTRINRDWTTRQRGEDRMDSDRMRQRQMGPMMDRDEDHRTIGRNWHRNDDDMDRGRGYAEQNEGRYYYEVRPRPRVKTCVEYENGDEFCRYRD
ncbi:hypothetical protein ACVMAJ_000147 [Bradyrhizobium sp. USDA 4448]